MSDTFIGEDTQIHCAIIGENSIIGNHVQVGIGEYAPSQYNPKVYESRISVIGSNTIVPNGTVIGKNVVIDNGLVPNDFTRMEIPSGGFVMKGGANE